MISNKGEITGTYLMMNMYMIMKQSVLITENKELVELERKNLGENYDVIKSNIGEEVLLLRKMSPTMVLILLQSGLQYEVPVSILVDENYDFLTDDLGSKPLFVYQSICLKDDINEPHIQLRTPIMQVGYKQYAIDGQPGKLVTICTSRFNNEVVQKQIFDRVVMQFQLHK